MGRWAASPLAGPVRPDDTQVAVFGRFDAVGACVGADHATEDWPAGTAVNGPELRSEFWSDPAARLTHVASLPPQLHRLPTMLFWGACLIALLAHPADIAAVTRAPEATAQTVDRGLKAAKSSADAYKRGDFEMAATEGVAALKIVAPIAGWDSKPVRLIAGVTVDALVKLGRNDEADAIIAKVRAAAEAKTSAPPPSSNPTSLDPSSDDSPELRAGKLAAKAIVAVQDGRDADAVDLAKRAIAVLDKEAPSSPSLFAFRTMLAHLHGARLQFDEAEALLSKNLSKADEASNDHQRHETLAAQGRIAVARGELAPAQAAYRKSLSVADRLGSPESRAESLAGLAEVAVAREQPHDAIALLEEAVTLQEGRAKIGAGHLLSPLSSLGEAYELAGRFDQAEPTLKRALGIAERQWGAQSPAGWRVRSQLGRLYRSMGQHDDAIEMFESLLKEQETTLPSIAPAKAATMNHLAEVLWAKGGDTKRTTALASRAAEIQEHMTSQVVTSGTEQEKRAYLERYVSGTDRILTYSVKAVPNDPDAARLGVNTILRRKGRVLDAVSGQLAAVRGRLDAATRAQLERLGQVRGQLSALALRGPNEGESAQAHRGKVETLREESNTLERELARVEQLQLSTEFIELSAVQQGLPKDAVLVEIALFREFDVHYKSFSRAFGDEHYAAYVVRSEGAPELVDLGPAAPIDRAIAGFRTALANPRTNIEALARSLDVLTMAKIRPHLGKTERVLISPDGALNLVPFSALIDERGRYLIERYEFTHLSSGRDLMRLQRDGATVFEGPVVLGAPDFSATGSSAGSGNGTRSAEMSAEMFPPLPGTHKEAEAVAKRLDARLLLGADATESAIKKLSRPLMLHVATHGFFLAEQGTATEGTRGIVYTKKSAGIWVPPRDADNPLVRSGLALTGANLRAAPDGEDGILTALEVAHLDLVGTQLVVLSACETGIGEVHNGEGVYGLRRALVIAGARSQVMSLWQVDDVATSDLMVRYYKDLRGGKGRSDALRRSQRRMLRAKKTAHPYYWAAFVPSGDWRPMAFEVPSDGNEVGRERRQRRQPNGHWRSYLEEKFHKPMWFFYGGHSRPIKPQSHDGAPAENTASFDLRFRAFSRPFFALGLDYGRHPWKSPDSPRQLEIAINRFEAVAEFDVFPTPNDWRVRPGIHPYLGAGLAWGRQHQLDEPVVIDSEPRREFMAGAGISLGADAAMYFRVTDSFVLQLRGGIAKPVYRLRADGARLDYDDGFPRAWRWQVGLGIGKIQG